MFYSNADLRLSEWQYASGKDLASQITPINLINPRNPLIVYNPTLNDSIITFTGVKESLDRKFYYGSITLHPFTGAILFQYNQPYASSAYKHYGQ
jgi:hypothetical protein